MRTIELNALQIAFNKQAFVCGHSAACDLATLENRTCLNDMLAQVIEFKRAPNLDDLIKRRVAILTAYQDMAYAEQYRCLVEPVVVAECQFLQTESARGTQCMSMAVATYLFKLMDYKDEYEVARLYTDGAFKAEIAGMFEGDYKLKFHLAPPPLAKLKFLRGGALDCGLRSCIKR